MEAIEVIWALLQILGVLTWSPQHKQAEQMVFQNKEEMAKVWVADGGKATELPERYDEIGEIRVHDPEIKDKLPKVDFQKHTVLAVFAGEKPSAGFTVKIEKVAQSRDGKETVVLYRETAPRGIAAAVLTYPSHVVVVKKLTGKVAFVSAESEEGKKLQTQLQAK